MREDGMEQEPADFSQHFENKTEYELGGMDPPADMTEPEQSRWHMQRRAALAAVRGQKALLAEQQSQIGQAADEEEEDLDDEAGVEDDPAPEPVALHQASAKLEVLPPQPGLIIPEGSVADLLERQVGICAALIGNIAEFVAGNEALPDVCFPFMDRISAMLTSSANAARVVGQLRGIATQTKQTIVTENWGKGAGGVR
jgi:hypothetical protein